MAGIDDYLKQFPELAKEDPEEVAQYVYETQMKATGADQDEFNEYFLGKQDGWWTKTAKSIGGAIKGDAEYPELGDMNSEGYGSLKAGAALMLGSDADAMKANASANPELIQGKDANGNDMFFKPDGTPAGYVNKPGLDVSDVGRFVGKAASFVPAGNAVKAVAGAGLAARAAVGGLASMGTDYLMQKGAGRDDADFGQVALTGVLGAGSEALAPVIGKIAQTAKKGFGHARWAKASDATKRAALNRQLTKDGFNPDDFAGWTPDEILEFGKNRVLNADDLSPGAAIANQEFGLNGTRGQKMPDGTFKERVLKTDQLNREEYLRSTGGMAGQKLADNEARNAELIGKNVDDFIDNLSGGQALGKTRNQSAQVAHSGLIRARKKSAKKYESKYKEAEQYNGEFSDEVMLDMPNRVKSRLEASNVFLDGDEGALGSLTRGAVLFIKELEKNPQTTVKALENQRKKMNSLINATREGTPDYRAMVIVKEEFDDALAEALDAGMYSGDPRAVEVLKEARSLYAKHAKKFNTNTKAGKVVQQMLDEEATPEEVGRYVFGSTGLSKDGAARVVKHYKKAVGKNSDGFNALRETFMHSITNDMKGDTKGIQAMVGTLKNALYKDGESVVKELYTPDEIGKLKRFVKAMDEITLKGDRAKSSGTAERLARMLSSSGWGDTPGISWMKDVLRSVQADRVIRGSIAPAKPISALPAVPATADYIQGNNN